MIFPFSCNMQVSLGMTLTTKTKLFDDAKALWIRRHDGGLHAMKPGRTKRKVEHRLDCLGAQALALVIDVYPVAKVGPLKRAAQDPGEGNFAEEKGRIRV